MYKDEKGQWNAGGAVGLVITVLLVVLLIVVIFKVLERI